VNNAHGLFAKAHSAGLAPDVVSGVGVAVDLDAIVGEAASDVLVVATRRTVAGIPALARLVAAGAAVHHEIEPNPTTTQALCLAARVDSVQPRTIVAVGGGSTIDLAKAARVLRPSEQALDGALRGESDALRTMLCRLVAVPTTAGTGSEMTQFATLYRDGNKVSLDHPRCRATLAVLDGSLTCSCPTAVAAPAFLDALSHAIESYWSRIATPESQLYAQAAMDTLVTLAPSCSVRLEQRDARTAHQTLMASAFAGIAISMTRTTAAHAFSYWLTSRYHLAHGFACALSLWWLADYNWRQRPAGNAGTELVLRRVGADPARGLFSPIAVANRVLTRAIAHGYCRPPVLCGEDIAAYVSAGMAVRNRAENNPVPLCASAATAQVAQLPQLTGITS
jgi:alcohol dehydrogenase class IV